MVMNVELTRIVSSQHPFKARLTAIELAILSPLQLRPFIKLTVNSI